MTESYAPGTWAGNTPRQQMNTLLEAAFRAHTSLRSYKLKHELSRLAIEMVQTGMVKSVPGHPTRVIFRGKVYDLMKRQSPWC